MGTRPLAATSKVSAAATTNYSKPLARQSRQPQREEWLGSGASDIHIRKGQVAALGASGAGVRLWRKAAFIATKHRPSGNRFKFLSRQSPQRAGHSFSMVRIDVTVMVTGLAGPVLAR
jgi:hypothetical protein